MTTFLQGLNISLVAAADLSAKQFLAIKVDSNGQAAVAAAGDPAIGVLQNNPLAGSPATVQLDGITKAKAGAAIAAGAPLMVNASGQFITATSTNYIVGFAREAAASGDIFAVILKSLGKL